MQGVIVPEMRPRAAPSHDCNRSVPVRIDGREREVRLHLGTTAPSASKTAFG